MIIFKRKKINIYDKVFFYIENFREFQAKLSSGGLGDKPSLEFLGRKDRNIYHLKTKFALAKSDKVIATSEATANEIQKFYKIDSNKIVL